MSETPITRRGRSVVLRSVVVTAEGDTRTTYYGPFLPHAGSACTGTMARISEAEYANGARDVDIFIVDVFIGDDESDAAVVATR